MHPRRNPARRLSALLALLLLWPACLSIAAAQSAPVHANPAASDDEPAPTCASCHAPFADPQPHSGMGRALLPPHANPILNAHPSLSLTRGAYTYSVQTRNGESTYSVTDGARTLTVPILWNFGANNQTWMLALNGKMYESLVSYYPIVNGLAVTTGDDRLQPTTLEQALGRELTAMDIKTCFGCHATNSLGTSLQATNPAASPSPTGPAARGAMPSPLPAGPPGSAPTNLPTRDHASSAPLAASAATPGQPTLALQAESPATNAGPSFANLMLSPAVLATASIPGMPDVKTLQPGVTCEHCHLGAAKHLLDASNGHFESTPPSLGKLTSEDLSNFCGKCHRTWDMVVRSRWRGEMNVRFQPYRLANSACYNGADARISCIACHNPHEDVVRDAAYYDKKCLACHTVDPHAGESRTGANSRTGASSQTSVDRAHRPPASAAAPQLLPAAFLAPMPQQGSAASRQPQACPVAKNNCTSCHMPKVVLPGSEGHLVFTDHQIRVAKPGDAYPN